VKGSPLLADENLIESFKYKTRLIMGYDAETNSILSITRGTDNFINMIEDIVFVKTDYNLPGCNDCTVHEGFLVAYNSLKEESNAYLLTLT
jgi:hypothetical protein